MITKIGDLGPVMWGRMMRYREQADAARASGDKIRGDELELKANELAAALLELGHQPPGET